MYVKIVFFVVWLGTLSVVGAEEPRAKSSYIVPKAELITYYQGQEPYVFFYPFGWSKDGKFAYFMEIRPGPFPICETRYYAVVINTVNNTKLWSHTLTKGEESCADIWVKRDEPASLKRAWPEIYTIAESQLIKHEIIQTDQSIDQLPFPGFNGKISLIITHDFHDDMSMFYVKKLVVTLGGKSIVSISSMGGFPLDAGIQGYIASPFASYFALIVNSFQLGQHYERVGPYYEIAGVNLEGRSDKNGE